MGIRQLGRQDRPLLSASRLLRAERLHRGRTRDVRRRREHINKDAGWALSGGFLSALKRSFPKLLSVSNRASNSISTAQRIKQKRGFGSNRVSALAARRMFRLRFGRRRKTHGGYCNEWIKAEIGQVLRVVVDDRIPIDGILSTIDLFETLRGLLVDHPPSGRIGNGISVPMKQKQRLEAITWKRRPRPRGES